MPGDREKKCSMADEYGQLDSSGDTYVEYDFQLESGVILKEAHVSLMCIFL